MSLLAQRHVLGRDLPPRTMNQMLQRCWKRSLSSYPKCTSRWVSLGATPPWCLTEGCKRVFSSSAQTVVAHLCSRQGLTFPRHSWHNALHLENEWQLHTMKNVRRIMGRCSAVPSVTEATQHTSFSFPLPFLSFLLSLCLSGFFFILFHPFLSWWPWFIWYMFEEDDCTTKQQNPSTFCQCIPSVLLAQCGCTIQYVLISTRDISSFPSVSVPLVLLWQAWGISSVTRLHVCWTPSPLRFHASDPVQGMEAFSRGMSEPIHQYSF